MNRLKKSHMIHFWLEKRTLSKIGIRRDLPQPVKDLLKNLQLILDVMGKTEFFLSHEERGKNIHYHYFSSKLYWRPVKEGKQKKWKASIIKTSKLPLFADDMIYVEDPVESATKPPKLAWATEQGCRVTRWTTKANYTFKHLQWRVLKL